MRERERERERETDRERERRRARKAERPDDEMGIILANSKHQAVNNYKC